METAAPVSPTAAAPGSMNGRCRHGVPGRPVVTGAKSAALASVVMSEA